MRSRARTMSRLTSLAVLWAAYGWTIVIALSVGLFMPVDSPLIKAGLVDLVATVMIFAISVIFNNSSAYDPYWSIAPIVMTGYWALPGLAGSELDRRAAIVVLLVVVWGVRLTVNFLRGWEGMHHEDWRYRDFRKRSGRHYWTLSFFGFHLVPTAVVFAACVPIYFACTVRTPIGPFDLIAAAIVTLGITIEAVADAQMRGARSRSESRGPTFRGGLWRFSRHPNYFGELLFWWGMAVFAIGADPSLWWTAAGALGVTALFLGVSIPLMENRMLRLRPDYGRVREETSVLIPWFPKGA